MFKKNVSFVVAIALITMVFSSCGIGGKRTSTTADGKMEISLATWVTGPVDEDNYAKRELEKAFPDISFKLIPFERSTYKDQLNTRIAGGEVPDIILRVYADELGEFAKQKIITEVPYDIIQKNAPIFLRQQRIMDVKFGLQQCIMIKTMGCHL